MTLCGQGTGDSERIGRKIRLTSLTVRWQLGRDNVLALTSGLAALAPASGALCLILDKQANGALPSGS